MKKISWFLLLCAAGAAGYYFYFYKKNISVSPYQLYAADIPGTYRIGFTNLDIETHIDKLAVTGTIPAWLSGVLFRNGPAKFHSGDTWVDWFDGLAMIHAFAIQDGHVSYTNKYLRTTDYESVAKTGRMTYGGFAQDPCKSVFSKIAAYFQPIAQKFPKVPNANVNIAKYMDHYVALTEIPLPVEFDPKTLETLGVMYYTDTLPQVAIHDTAHPHYDPVRKEHLIYFTKFGRVSSHNLCRIPDGSVTREIIATIDVEEPSYMHSFGITKNYAILTGLPLVVTPLDLLLKQQAFIKNFKWKPELGTKFMVVDRIKNKLVGIFKGEPFFAFHVVNAFEEHGDIIIDIVVYPNANGIGKAKITDILAPRHTRAATPQKAALTAVRDTVPADRKQLEQIPVGSSKENKVAEVDVIEAGQLKRFTINLKAGTVTSRKLLDEYIELPRINYEKNNGADYKYVYAYSKTPGQAYYVADKLVKIEVKNGKQLVWQEDNCFPGEPVFIPKPDGKAEDDGVIVSIVLDATRARSFLLILDAKNCKEIARAQVPHHIPFGIHGQFYFPQSRA